MPSFTGAPLGPAWGEGEIRLEEGVMESVETEDGTLDIEAATWGTE